MATFADRYGQALSTESAAAAQHYARGLDRLLSFDSGGPEHFQRAIEADSGFALAHAGLAAARWQQGRRGEGQHAAREAVRLLHEGGTSRERGHAAVVAAALEGGGYLDTAAYDASEVALAMIEAAGYADAAGHQAPNPLAVRLGTAHLEEFPRDALVLLVVIVLTIFAGEDDQRRRLLGLFDRLAPEYEDDWWFPSWRGLCHQQLRERDRSYELIDTAYERNNRNPLAAHGYGHLFYADGERRAGEAAFLGEWLRGYDARAPYHSHVAWHHAMLELRAGEPAAALDTYKQAIDPAHVEPVRTTLLDSVEFLWRAQLYAPGMGASWAGARAHAVRVVTQPGVPLRDVLAAAVFAGSGEHAALDALIASLTTLDAHGYPLAGSLVLPLALGLRAFAAGDYEEAIRRLAPVVDETHRMGGSLEQGDMFEETLIEALLRVGRPADAAARVAGDMQDRAPAHAAVWLSRIRQRAGEEAPRGV